MKKIILTAIVVLGFTFANAQTEKGKWLVSGSTSLSFGSSNTTFKADNGQTEDGPKTSSFNVKPAVGYFVAENFTIGLAADFSSDTTKDDGDKSTTSSVSIIPQVGYYFGKSKVKPFLNAGLGFASVSTSDSDISPSGTAWGINGGVAYFVSKSVSFDFSVGYQSVSLKIDETIVSPSFNVITAGVVSQIGIAVYF